MGSHDTVFFGESLTRQEFKDHCDLGSIIRRFSKTPEGRQALFNSKNVGQYLDVSAISDFRAVRNVILRAQEAIQTLPSQLRSRFDHDVDGFLDYVSDPKNLEEMRSLGLAAPVEPVESKVSEPSV